MTKTLTELRQLLALRGWSDYNRNLIITILGNYRTKSGGKIEKIGDLQEADYDQFYAQVSDVTSEKEKPRIVKDIIITGKQGSGKSEFATKHFNSEDYKIVDAVSLGDAKEISARTNRSDKPYVFITQDEVDLPARRFIVIQMPE